MRTAVNGASIAASFTRPADTTAYASADLVANSTTAGSVVPLSFATAANSSAAGGIVNRIRLLKSGTTATNGQFRVHLYTASPTVANGDNAALSTNKAADYLGYADVTVSAFTDGCAGVSSSNLGLTFAGSTTLYALLEARAAYTPANAEVFTVTLDLYRY